MAAASASSIEATQVGEDEWGWDALAEETDTVEKNLHMQDNPMSAGASPGRKRGNHPKQVIGVPMNGGITSSPSFQELEQAIGESLALNLTSPSPGGSANDLSGFNNKNFGYNGMPRSGSRGKFGGKSGGGGSASRQQNGYHHRNQMNMVNNMNAMGMGTQMYSMPPVPSHLMPGAGASGVESGGDHHSGNNLRADNNGGKSSSGSTIDARTEMAPHINEIKSRALILFHDPSISPASVRNACQKFGILYYIRPEFHSKGVTFLSYFDLNLAVTAQANLPSELGDDLASAHFSVMLHAINSNTEESQLIVSNLPCGDNGSIGAENTARVESVCARYGQLRSLQKLHDSNGESLPNGKPREARIMVEFLNIQDARLAMSELSASSTQLFGDGVTVEVAPLEKHKQTSCRQLLSSLSRWRTELAADLAHQSQANSVSSSMPQDMSNPMMMQQAGMDGMQYGMYPYPTAAMQQAMQGGQMSFMNFQNGTVPNGNMQYYNSNHNSGGGGNSGGRNGKGNGNFNDDQMDPANHQMQQMQQMQQIQLQQLQQLQHQMQRKQAQSHPGQAMNMDGNATVFNGDGRTDGMRDDQHVSQYGNDQQQNFSGGNGRGMVNHNTNFSKPLHHYPNYVQRRATKVEQDDTEFVLDLQKIGSAKDNRTTVMVRNIPNKYTQQMLLDEVNVNHDRTYDFFYLPIDFKNRCNVGYAFINFVEPDLIIEFSKEFQGHRWKNFNSGKVCDITYARIQGQAAMVARFQNSSLLDKDDAYKPLLFKGGEKVPFPDVKKPVVKGQGETRMNASRDSNDSNSTKES